MSEPIRTAEYIDTYDTPEGRDYTEKQLLCRVEQTRNCLSNNSGKEHIAVHLFTYEKLAFYRPYIKGVRITCEATYCEKQS
jgi:hypothetical protein